MAKRIILLLLACLIAGSCGFSVSALDFIPDADRDCTLEITMQYDGKPLPGGSLSIIRVAAVDDDGAYNYFFTYTEEFSECSIALEDMSAGDWTSAKITELTAELEKIARDTIREQERDPSIPPHERLRFFTRNIGWDGRVFFDRLKPGLYLVIQEEAAPGFQRISPYLVSVPTFDEESFSYDYSREIVSKNAPETFPTWDKPTETTKPSKLPQTGQNNWPVPVMAVVGLLVFAAGAMLVVDDRKKKKHED